MIGEVLGRISVDRMLPFKDAVSDNEWRTMSLFYSAGSVNAAAEAMGVPHSRVTKTLGECAAKILVAVLDESRPGGL